MRQLFNLEICFCFPGLPFNRWHLFIHRRSLSHWTILFRLASVCVCLFSVYLLFIDLSFVSSLRDNLMDCNITCMHVCLIVWLKTPRNRLLFFDFFQRQSHSRPILDFNLIHCFFLFIFLRSWRSFFSLLWASFHIGVSSARFFIRLALFAQQLLFCRNRRVFRPIRLWMCVRSFPFMEKQVFFVVGPFCRYLDFILSFFFANRSKLGLLALPRLFISDFFYLSGWLISRIILCLPPHSTACKLLWLHFDHMLITFKIKISFALFFFSKKPFSVYFSSFNLYFHSIFDYLHIFRLDRLCDFTFAVYSYFIFWWRDKLTVYRANGRPPPLSGFALGAFNLINSLCICLCWLIRLTTGQWTVRFDSQSLLFYLNFTEKFLFYFYNNFGTFFIFTKPKIYRFRLKLKTNF